MKTIALFLALLLLVFCQQKIEKTATINAPKQKNKKALIIPASLNELYLCDTFKKYIKLIYNLDCVISKPTTIEESLRSSTNPYYFSANKILRFLTKVKPDTVDYIVLVTSKDIVSPHKLKQANGSELTVPDYGIFGYGQCPGQATAISTYRLQLKPVSKKLLSERFVKPRLSDRNLS